MKILKYFSAVAAVMLLVSCASDLQQQTCDVRISWDYNSLVEMESVNVENAGYVEKVL